MPRPNNRPTVCPRRLRNAFWAKVNKHGPTMPHMSTPCWEWTGSRGHVGHGQAYIGPNENDPKDTGVRYAHRVSWSIAHGDPGPLDVLHICDNSPCVRPDHLHLGDQQVNMDDKVARSRQTRGADIHTSRFTEDVVLAIRAAGRTASQEDIGKTYGVSGESIGNILQGTTWSHVGGPRVVEKTRAGADNGNSKLTEDDVRAIRAIGRSEPVKSIAARYGLSAPAVSYILLRKTWKNVV